MIESLLFFLLGFLSASFLALMLAPAILARVARLTRQRIEAAQPLSMAEIKADRDQLRAEFAVTSRRLELHIADLKARSAKQRIEIGRILDERDAAVLDRDRLEANVKVYEQQLAMGGDALSGVQAELRLAKADFEQRKALINDLELRIHELTGDIDSSRLKIAALHAQIEAAGSQIDSLTEARRVAEARIVDLTAEIERMAAVISEERDRGDNERPAITRLEAENSALDARLRSLTEERNKLAFELQSIRVRDLSTPPDAADIASLKDRLGDIAARITRMAADHEGPRSTLNLLIANSPDRQEPLSGPDTSGTKAKKAPRTRSSRRKDSPSKEIQALRTSAAND